MNVLGWVILILAVVFIILLAARQSARDVDFIGLNPLIRRERDLWLARAEESEVSDDVQLADSRLARAAEAALETEGETSESSIDTQRAGEAPQVSAAPADETNEESVSLATPRPFKEGGQYSRKEETCRQVLEEIYGLPFPKVRPDFLKNPATGRNLELDGYCHSVRVGFEFNGAQHYAYPNNYHKKPDDFLNQVQRDNYKYGLCKRFGIHLIVIPHDVPNGEIREFINQQLPKRGRGVIYAHPRSSRN